MEVVGKRNGPYLPPFRWFNKLSGTGHVSPGGRTQRPLRPGLHNHVLGELALGFQLHGPGIINAQPDHFIAEGPKPVPEHAHDLIRFKVRK